ncbi:MAG TPA: phosphoglycerate dehydrogenase [Firmicutes bacterium]|nr:phosphoglycerate dehydrogenase [Bacillota bacterium]
MKVLVSDKISQAGIDVLQKHFPVDVKLKLPPEELAAIIGEYDALVVRSETKVTKDILAKADKLKVIGRAGVGVDNIDVEMATARGIIVLNAPEGNTIAATEHTVALMLAMARKVPQAFQSMKQGKWERAKFMGVEVRGKTLGVIGLGRIGAGVTKRALAMDMKVMVYDPFLSEERAASMGVKLVKVQEIIEQADFITVHAPLTKETKYLLNKEAFAKMKPGVRLVNCARGGIIEEQALYDALVSGKVAAAALDVFEKEPINPDNPLLTLDNVIVTPHLGASTEEAQVNVAVDVAEGIINALKGEPVRTAVNIAPVSAEALSFIGPYLNLAEKMGHLAVRLIKGPISKVEITYQGEIGKREFHPITTATLKGLLAPILQETVNFVNAPNIAKNRGITIRETVNQETENFTNFITLCVASDKDQITVSGALFGKTDPRIVEINGYHVDAAPAGYVLVSPHIDKPGIIGQVGTILGANGINIAGMQVGRKPGQKPGGESIMLLAIDNPASQDVINTIKGVDGIKDIVFVDFGGHEQY